MFRFSLVMVIAVLAPGLGRAQVGAKKDNPGEVEVLFANGSLVRLTMIQEQIQVETLYGKLTIPLKDVRRIEFGVHFPEGMEAKVEAAIKQLNSADFKERDGAMRELAAQGIYAYPALLRASKSVELEVSKRAAEALARLRAKVPAKELRLAEDDKVTTRTFTIVGRIVTPALKARTEYFGDAQLPLAQLRILRALVETKETEVTIDAAKYSNSGDWLETSVTVDNNSVLSISASGQVDLLPRQPGMIVCGPQGYGPGAAGGFGGAVGFAAAPGKKGAKGAMVRQFSGCLLGRIGENGDIFVVGERFEGALEREGKLYLHINPSTHDNTSTGAFQVRIGTRY